jgi:hypothetical protein
MAWALASWVPIHGTSARVQSRCPTPAVVLPANRGTVDPVRSPVWHRVRPGRPLIDVCPRIAPNRPVKPARGAAVAAWRTVRSLVASTQWLAAMWPMAVHRVCTALAAPPPPGASSSPWAPQKHRPQTCRQHPPKVRRIVRRSPPLRRRRHRWPLCFVVKPARELPVQKHPLRPLLVQLGSWWMAQPVASQTRLFVPRRPTVVRCR